MVFQALLFPHVPIPPLPRSPRMPCCPPASGSATRRRRARRGRSTATPCSSTWRRRPWITRAGMTWCPSLARRKVCVCVCVCRDLNSLTAGHDAPLHSSPGSLASGLTGFGSSLSFRVHFHHSPKPGNRIGGEIFLPEVLVELNLNGNQHQIHPCPAFSFFCYS